MSESLTLHRDRAMLLVIDVQTKLLPVIRHSDRVVEATAILLEAAAIFKIPVVATVQYVKGLGPTHETVAAIMADQGIEPIEKAAFSACRDETSRSRIKELARPQVIVAGIEGHVCVLQSVLDLLEMDCQPFVCSDAVSSRYKADLKEAFRRMRQAGAVVAAAESILFELCNVSGTPEFKEVLKLVKRYDKVRE